MPEKITYLPWAEDHIIADKILNLGRAVKRDIWVYLRYQNQSTQIPRVVDLKKQCRERILTRLSVIANMQQTFQKSNDEWKSILKKALSKVYKHKDSEEFQKKLSDLFNEYDLDHTNTRVHFVRAYMEIVWRIPKEQINIPFHW